jgi:hypothetical protein
MLELPPSNICWTLCHVPFNKLIIFKQSASNVAFAGGSGNLFASYIQKPSFHIALNSTPTTLFSMPDFDLDTPNTPNGHKEQLHAAKQWLIDNPKEKQSVAAEIFKITSNPNTLSNSITRGELNKHHRGQNEILS